MLLTVLKFVLFLQNKGLDDANAIIACYNMDQYKGALGVGVCCPYWVGWWALDIIFIQNNIF